MFLFVAPPNAPPNVTCPFLESKLPIEEVMSMSSCEDRESPAGDLTTMCTYSTSSPSLVVLRCTCTDGDGAETYCEVDIPGEMHLVTVFLDQKILVLQK